ncbi:uncharacterized protein P884DRAFT_332420 [Thermothelomyces heterothallicus CBS 202.75]|uniref:uncharacterized protein n=1 Tax=Thermothelomyces heterothallicus CBS 202.75 TaxID=1149848 RepID=UPI0037444D0F
MAAETAEMEADRALMAAHESVREAREHVRMLELEAKEEARRAKIKEHHAKEFSKRGKLLGIDCLEHLLDSHRIGYESFIMVQNREEARRLFPLTSSFVTLYN